MTMIMSTAAPLCCEVYVCSCGSVLKICTITGYIFNEICMSSW